MENVILTLKEVKEKLAFNPLGKVKHRDVSTYKLFILSDVIEYMMSTIPYKRFEPINMQNGYLIVESSINQ
jgi:hypothetical protein